MSGVKEAAKHMGVAPVRVCMWARKGSLSEAERKVQEVAGTSYWLIPETALDNFETGKPGPKLGSKRSEANKAENN